LYYCRIVLLYFKIANQYLKNLRFNATITSTRSSLIPSAREKRTSPRRVISLDFCYFIFFLFFFSFMEQNHLHRSSCRKDLREATKKKFYPRAKSSSSPLGLSLIISTRRHILNAYIVCANDDASTTAIIFRRGWDDEFDQIIERREEDEQKKNDDINTSWRGGDGRHRGSHDSPPTTGWT